MVVATSRQLQQASILAADQAMASINSPEKIQKEIAEVDEKIRQDDLQRLAKRKQELASPGEPSQRTQQMMQGPTTPTAEQGLSGGTAFKAGQSRTRASKAEPTLPAHLQRASEKGYLSSRATKEHQKQIQAYTEQMRATKTLMERYRIMRKMHSAESMVAGYAFSNEQREKIDMSRRAFWRAIAATLPEAGLLFAGWGVVVTTSISYVIWIISASKNIRYAGRKEPLGISYLLTPPKHNWKPFSANIGEMLMGLTDKLKGIWYLGSLVFAFGLVVVSMYFIVEIAIYADAIASGGLAAISATTKMVGELWGITSALVP